MKLVKIGTLYLNMDGGLSALDGGDNILVASEVSLLSESPEAMAEIRDPEHVVDLRAWLDRNSDDISKRGGIGPQTTASVRQG